MALALGALMGRWQLTMAQTLEPGIWLTLGLLLYATFCQVPLVELTGMIGYLWWVPRQLLRD